MNYLESYRSWRIEFKGGTISYSFEGERTEGCLSGWRRPKRFHQSYGWNFEALHPEVPAQLGLVKDHEPEKSIGKLPVIWGCNSEVFRQSLRIRKADKSYRELMIYFLLQTGPFSNQQIGEPFGLSYSSLSKRAGMVRKRLREQKTFRDKFDRLDVLIKLWPLFAAFLVRMPICWQYMPRFPDAT